MSVITRTVVLLTCIWFAIPSVSHAMEMWPESFDVSIVAGATGSSELVLLNDDSQDATFQIDLLQVHIGETRDDLSFAPLDEQTASWIKLDDAALSLSANTKGKIGISFSPSADLPAGVTTIGVQVTRQALREEEVGIQTAIVSLGFVTVGMPEGSYQWLSSDVETGSGWSLPVTSTLSIRNEGERVVIPKGTMRITSLFGREVASVAINESGSRVVSGQTRTFTTQWGKSEEDHQPLAIGVFTVDVEASPWEGAEVFHARQHIVLFPWRSALIAAVILAILAWVHRFSRSP